LETADASEFCDPLSGEGADENGPAYALAKPIADGTLGRGSIAATSTSI